MRRSFSEDPAFFDRLFDLLETAFPGLRQAALDANRLGATWQSISTPFVYQDHGRLVSHIGIIELPLVLLGSRTTVGSVHAVVTHPDYRRRGYYRTLMEEVLRYSRDRYETLILSTENPEYYEPFGFRLLGEHRFSVRGHDPFPGSGGLRQLALDDDRDLALFHRLLETRTPVSNVVGVDREKAVFCFNEGRRPLHYADDLDVMVCMEMNGQTLELYDIVGPRIPALEALLGKLPTGVEEVITYFSPDRLECSAEATPHVLDQHGPSYLMCRGPFAAENEAFTLPRSART